MSEPFARGRRSVLVHGLIPPTVAIVARTLSAGAEAQQDQAPVQQLETIGTPPTARVMRRRRGRRIRSGGERLSTLSACY